jgi:hypothetical protein
MGCGCFTRAQRLLQMLGFERVWNAWEFRSPDCVVILDNSYVRRHHFRAALIALVACFRRRA